MITVPPQPQYFRMTTVKAPPSRVDRKAKVIHGAALMQLGKINEPDSRPWFVDETTLAQVIELGNRPNKGIKARFTHPNMSDDGMGKHLGRWQQFRLDGDTVRADLHLAETAFTSPSGDMGTYVMDLAEEDPEAFGVSLAPGLSREEMEEAETDEKLQPIRLASLRAADVVDDPAATRGGFFSMTDNESDIPAKVSAFLDSHFSGASPETIRARFDGFMTKYFATKGVPVMSTGTQTVGTPTTVVAIPNEQVTQLQTELSQLRAKVDGLPQAIEHVRAQETARLAEINSLFATAGMPEVAAEFFSKAASDQTVDQARKMILDSMLSKQGSATVGGGTNDKPDKKDPDAQFKKEYADDREYFAKSGTTEADYILSRRITENHQGRPLGLVA